MITIRPLLVTVAAASALVGCRPASTPPPQPADADALRSAVQQLTDVIVYDIFSPPQASRVYAYGSIAAYEALRQGDTAYRSLAGQLHGLTPVPAPEPNADYSPVLAGVHAFLTVGRALTFSQARVDTILAATDASFRSRLSKPAYERSIAYADRVAQHVLAWAGTDGFKESRALPKYSVTSEPGRWIPTPPAYMDAIEPNWGTLRPFVMDSGRQFRPVPPLPFSTARTSPFFRQVQEVYDVTRSLTDEQRAIAAFWDCNPFVMHVQGHTMFATKKISPGGHWMGIVAIATRQAGADLTKTAEAFARTAIALADGFISVWAEKYASNLVRPETVINKFMDEAWLPLLQTPPFPEYTSGHSVISTAAARVLTEQFGEQFAFVDSVEVQYGLPPRSFTSFEQAASEAAVSRLYGGIHFRRAIEAGQAQGGNVGALVVERVHTHPGGAVVASSNRGLAK